MAGWPSGSTLLGSPGEWNAISGTSDIYFIIEYESIKTPVDNSSSNIIESSNKKLTAYPNPAKDRIYIQSSKAISAFLISIEGKRVGTFIDNELDVSVLPHGTYWINIKEDRRTFRYPIVIE